MEMIGFLGRGIAHERDGRPCQDAVGTRVCANGSQVYALADGAGSAEFAAEAAAANVAAVLDYFEETNLALFLQMDQEQRREEILDKCRRRLEGIQAEKTAQWYDLAATLLFFVTNGTVWAAGHLGDGIILAQDAEGRTRLYSEPDNAGRSNATYFTVSPDAAEHLRICGGGPQEHPARVLLMSDGPCDMFRTRNGAVRTTTEELLDYVRTGDLRTAEELAEALDQMTVYAIDRMDDWSVLILSSDGFLEAAGGLPVHSMLRREEQKRENEYKGDMENG